MVRVLAPNPGLFTLEGTNTWVLGADGCLVIDPGPDDPGHLDAILAAAGRITAILLTHAHPDHAAGAEPLARRSGAPVLAASPDEGRRPIRDGDRAAGGQVTLEVVSAPGHSQDHVVFFHPGTRALFTGDTVLGRGTSVIDPPDGDLSDYLRSLRRMRRLRPRVIYPGHGPVVDRASERIDGYLSHRQEREEQILRALAPGPATPGDLLPEIYAEYPMELRPAASRSVLAHLLKLEGEGRVVRRGGDRFELVLSSGSGSWSTTNQGNASSTGRTT